MALGYCWLWVLLLLISHVVLELEASPHAHRSLLSLETSPVNQTYRTAFHFQPAKNWMNDPNGPMIYKGIYHLFYQHNPYGAVSGNIVWGHSTSKDLINWTPHEPALTPSEPYDIKGCWSGSATIISGNKPVILYTGVNRDDQQVQNLAVPKDLSDPFLKEWIKSPKNPLMTANPANKIDPSSFRDPSTAWLGSDGTWRVIVGSKSCNLGMAILYRSKDFVNWTKAQYPLHWAMETGMWECVDFYPVPIDRQTGVDTSTNGSSIKHVLKASRSGHDYYTIGTYDHVRDIYYPDEGSVEDDSGLRYDYGKFYASKTFFDGAKSRRILWAWIDESSSQLDDEKKGWAGVQAIPRSIWRDESGKQLIQWPVTEIEKLRAKRVNLPVTELKGEQVVEIPGVTAAQADVEVLFDAEGFEKAEVLDQSWTNPQELCGQKNATVKGGLGPFGLLVLASKDLQEYTAVFFRIFRVQMRPVLLMCSDQSRSSLNEDNDKTTYGAFVDINPTQQNLTLSLRSLIDHSIVESFGEGGKSCITARVYPTLATDDRAHLYAFNNGNETVRISKLSAWSMTKAQVN